MLNWQVLAWGTAWWYLGEDSVPAAGVQCGIVTVLPGQVPVDVQLWYSARGAALRGLEAVSDEGCALLGQQQKRLHALAKDNRYG